jgi:hypothetical protein
VRRSAVFREWVPDTREDTVSGRDDDVLSEPPEEDGLWRLRLGRRESETLRAFHVSSSKVMAADQYLTGCEHRNRRVLDEHGV